MSDWDVEWAAAKAAAREETTRTRLNAFEPGAGGGSTDLTVTPAAKEAAAAYLEEELTPAVVGHGVRAVSLSVNAAARLSGWQCGTGLAETARTWQHKVRAVGEWLTAEAEALRGVAGSFGAQEGQFVLDVRRSASALDGPTPPGSEH
ncbi:hypothetical protein [Streptomyces carpaticus]|uniref:YbaB/EbfC DNA-binding family protein n=1 Tax=Streptomyces carpaticus TaxID=285558 RepID=A0ABV4ZHM0_9ACTN